MKKNYLLIAAAFFCLTADVNAQTWSTAGSGIDDQVDALAVYNADLYAGGWFTFAGGAPASKLPNGTEPVGRLWVQE